VAQQKILVLSSRFGEGHYQAGEALAQSFLSQRSCKITVRHLDFGAFFFKKTDYLMRMVYLNMVKKTPRIWRKLYEKTAEVTLDNWHTFLWGINPEYFLQYIQDFKPDVIVNTHFIPTGILAAYKKKGLIQVPLVTVVTDYLVHGIWVHPDVDQYVVGSKDALAALLRMGIPEERVSLSGIPVRLCFEKKLSRYQMKQKLGLHQDRTTVLIMGGSSGLGGKEHEIIQLLARLGKEVPIQLLVVCGSDQSAYRTVTQRAYNGDMYIKVFRYVDHIQDLMVAADLVITKGGALTISEALKLGRPLLMYKPIPGHENGNAAFVQNKGAGRMVNSAEELEAWLTKLLKDQSILREMSEAACNLLPPHSADHAVKGILRLIGRGDFLDCLDKFC